MPPGTFSFCMNVTVKLEGGVHSVNIPIDAVVMPKIGKPKQFPVFIEAKSAGDFTNTNKRRKEEAVKMAQLRCGFKPDARALTDAGVQDRRSRHSPARRRPPVFGMLTRGC